MIKFLNYYIESAGSDAKTGWLHKEVAVEVLLQYSMLPKMVGGLFEDAGVESQSTTYKN